MIKQIGFVLLCVLFLTSVHAQSICIDPGHGGSDPGACGNGLEEADIVLSVAGYLYTQLNNAGWTVYRTRTSNTTVSLSSRTSYANSLGVDIFVSIHCNAYNGSAHGTETYCYSGGSSTSYAIRNSINPEVVDALDTYNRGVKTANFYVLVHTNMPAALAELAFIDNASDANKLGNSYYQQQAAIAIKDALQTATIASSNVRTAQVAYTAPQFSPDGSKILATSPGHRGLYLIALANGRTKILHRNGKLGYKMRWLSDSEIQYVVPETKERFIININGQIRRSKVEQTLEAIAEDGNIWIVANGTKQQITNGEDVYFNPCISPDNTMVVYEGLSTGLHLCKVNGDSHINLGAGNNPTWTPDSQKILFDHAQDDGHRLISGDIWMIALANPSKRINLTQCPEFVAQNPCVSRDGRRITFDAQGGIFVADLRKKSLKNLREIPIVIRK